MQVKKKKKMVEKEMGGGVKMYGCRQEGDKARQEAVDHNPEQWRKEKKKN